MIKVLIVEDENIIRKGLISSIDWLSMDCKIVGEAMNGEIGLKLIEEYSPDLVITDIRMPIMNGIEMLKEAENRGLFFEKIILTSYGEFSYAQEGIKLGIISYILKPIDEEIFYESLKKVRERLEKLKNLKTFEEISIQNKNIELYNPKLYITEEKKKNKYIVKTIEKIINNYSEKLNIKEVAEELDISSSYLSRKFKEVTGETFLDLLNKYRIQKSIKLLQEEEYKIYEISEKVGFTDYKHFCSVFKKYLKIAPGDFRKQNIILVNEK